MDLRIQFFPIFNSYSDFVFTKLPNYREMTEMLVQFSNIALSRYRKHSATASAVLIEYVISPISTPIAIATFSNGGKAMMQFFFLSIPIFMLTSYGMVCQLLEFKNSTELVNRTSDDIPTHPMQPIKDKVHVYCESAQPSNDCAKLSSHSICFFCHPIIAVCHNFIVCVCDSVSVLRTTLVFVLESPRVTEI